MTNDPFDFIIGVPVMVLTIYWLFLLVVGRP